MPAKIAMAFGKSNILGLYQKPEVCAFLILILGGDMKSITLL